MDNCYKFVDEDNKIIFKVTSANRVIPAINEMIVVRWKVHSVSKVEEILNFDTFTREITIHVL